MVRRTRPPKLINVAVKDYPGSAISVSYPDRWELVHRFRWRNRLYYIAGFPPSTERSSVDHFYGLPAEVNRSLNIYRQYKLFAPRPIQQFQVAWNTRIGQGRVIGTGELRVNFQPIGQAQIWKGERHGVLWECFVNQTGRHLADWQKVLTIFWRSVERDLAVKQIFTEPHEPTFERGYTDFLRHLGYGPDPNFERWWSKNQT